MPDQISVTFLGTAAGKPSQTRNVSSLVVKLDSKLWVFDAGEGTQHQLMDPRCKLQMGKISKIFVTHMHADHVNGLPGLLCTISAGEGSVLPGQEDPRVEEAKEVPPTQIYGPHGLRLFLRHALSLTHSVLSRPYVVHELLWPDEQPSAQGEGEMHPSERRGRDVVMQEGDGGEGGWRDFVGEEEDGGLGVRVSAAPILHTIRCIGYLLLESPRPLPILPHLYIPHLKSPQNAAALAAQGVKNPLTLLSRLQSERQEIALADGTVLRPPGVDPRGGRRIAILGDTYDAGPMLPLLLSPGSSTATEAPEWAERLFPPSSCSSSSSSATATATAPPPSDYLDLLIHESTNVYLPTLDESHSPLKPSPASLESVTALARDHGHSTPQVAGSFARRARARRVVLNHLSTKYPDPTSERLAALREGDDDARERREKWGAMLREIERQAGEELVSEGGARELEGEKAGEGGGWRVRTARDFWEVEVVRRDKIGGGKGAEAEGKGGKAAGGEKGKEGKK
ncbi:hypothetical protein JCM6882_004943 [Rhodosporidiobolus microsporus]